MKSEYRTYTFKRYEYGWMVVSSNIDGTDENMEMCFANEADAIALAMRLNEQEAKRVEDVKKRKEEIRKSIVKPANPYNYSITGYFGD